VTGIGDTDPRELSFAYLSAEGDMVLSNVLREKRLSFRLEHALEVL
jgi:hypothetical protein